MARNALIGFALLAAGLTLGGCSGKADEAQAAEAQLAALRAHTDSLRKEHIQAAAPVGSDSTASGSATAPDSATLAATPAAATVKSDSAVRAEAEAVAGRFGAEGAGDRGHARNVRLRRRDARSLLVAHQLDQERSRDRPISIWSASTRTSGAPSNSVVVLREKVSSKRHKMRVGDQLSRARLVQIRPRDAVFMIQDFGFERQETLSLRKQEDVTP